MDAGWQPDAATGSTFDDGWQPPDELDRDIARFNAVQRIVYRTVRAEVGAGAANFIRSCCSSSDGTPAEPVHGAELLADGSWDAEGLRSAVQDARIEQPWDAYHELIQREIEILRAHIGEARAAELEQLIEQAYQDEDRA